MKRQTLGLTLALLLAGAGVVGADDSCCDKLKVRLKNAAGKLSLGRPALSGASLGAVVGNSTGSTVGAAVGALVNAPPCAEAPGHPGPIPVDLCCPAPECYSAPCVVPASVPSCCPMPRPGMPVPPCFVPPPPPVVHVIHPAPPTTPALTTIILLGKTDKGCCVQVDSGNGTTVQCSKMTLLGPNGKAMKVYVADGKLCVRGDGFKGAVHRIVSNGDNVSVELTPPKSPVVSTTILPAPSVVSHPR